MKTIKLFSEKDQTVLELLKANGISNKIIKSAKAKGNIQKDHKVIWLAKEIKERDIITLIIEEENSDMLKVEMPLDIVYEDSNVIIISKSYGLSCMSTIGRKEDTLLNGLQYYLDKKNILTKLHLINRLDRNTTGLMMVALNRFAASALSLQLKKELKRKYYCLVEGNFDKDEGRIDVKIAKESMLGTRRCVRNDGKDSITLYKVVKQYKGFSLLEIELLTGRTHQIRVSMAHIGHPLIGDDLYNINYNYEELMLHSFYIEYNDPEDNSFKSFKTDIPERFSKYIGEHE